MFVSSSADVPQNPHNEPTPEPSFVCTICWSPQHPPSTPRLLGTSCRIVCEACWRAVLDLSICWVCGECIVRGEEVVSLGWCFWHETCFGCLMCGVKINISRVEIDNAGLSEARFMNEDEEIVGNEEIGRKRKRKQGVELTSIPLCEWCSIEAAGESESEVLERGLDTVSKFDGGLSRNRLDKLSEEKGELREASRTLLRTPRRLRGVNNQEQKTRRLINRSLRCSNRWRDFARAQEGIVPLLQDAADMGLSEDGSIDDGHCNWDKEEGKLSRLDNESKPDIYASNFDPVGEPVLKPSKTKGLPKWMSLLPSNMSRERELKGNIYSSDFQSHPHELLDISMPLGNRLDYKDHTSTGSDCTCPKRILSGIIDVPSAPIEIPKRGNMSNTICPECSSPAIRHKNRSTISFDRKITREHSFGDLNRTDRHSQTMESIYITPPEYPFKERLRRQKTSYPHGDRPSLTRRESLRYFTYDPSESSKDACCELSRGQSLQVTSPPAERCKPSSFLPNSSEYVQRYHPNSPDSGGQTYVPKETKLIIDKIKRQRVGKRSIAGIAEKRVGNKGWSDPKRMVEDEEYGLDPRREDLRRELRNLFFDKADHAVVEHVIQDFYQIMVQVQAYDQAGRPSKDVLENELKQLYQSLQKLHATSTSPSLNLPGLPDEILQYVDAGRNPDIYTREFVESSRRSNQLLKGKMAAFSGFRDVLAEEMARTMPEIREDIGRVLEETGGDRKALGEEEGNKICLERWEHIGWQSVGHLMAFGHGVENGWNRQASQKAKSEFINIESERKSIITSYFDTYNFERGMLLIRNGS
ncbi:hypothetical protein B7494_g3911 [Chlorociboria aeruginascens]|nr:hypothetical protein B7494_g3911 [Chlorociboria aeruginascens]